MVDALILCQMKGLMKIHVRGKFHFYTICGSKVINFQIVSWQCRSHEMGPFWGFHSSFSPKDSSNLLKFGPEVVHRETKSVYEQCFKIMNLSTNGTYPKFSFLDNFWAQFTPGKQIILPKNQIFPRNYILSTIRWHKSQVPDKSENSYKNYQKYPFFGPKMGLNCPLGPAQGVKTNSQIAYHGTIHP